MTGNDKYIWIVPAGFAVAFMTYSGFAYYLRIKNWKKLDGAVVDCEGSLKGDNNIVYECLIELKDGEQVEIVSVTSGLTKRKKGERVRVVVNPRNSRDFDIVDTGQKLVAPFVISAFIIWSIIMLLLP